MEEYVKSVGVEIPIREGMLSSFIRDDAFITAEGFDEAIMGYEEVTGRVIYSVSECFKILMKQGMKEEEISDYFDENIRGLYLGEQTPIWCEDSADAISDIRGE